MLELFHDKMQKIEIEPIDKYGNGKPSMKSDLQVLRKFKGKRDKIVNEIADNLKIDLERMLVIGGKKEGSKTSGDYKQMLEEKNKNEEFEKNVIITELDDFIKRYQSLPDPYAQYLKTKTSQNEMKKKEAQGYKLSSKLRRFIDKELKTGVKDRLLSFEQFAFVSQERMNPLLKNNLEEIRKSQSKQEVSANKFSVTEFWSKQQQVMNLKAVNMESDKMKLLRFSSLMNKQQVLRNKKKPVESSKEQEELIDNINMKKIFMAHSQNNKIENEMNEVRKRFNNKMSGNVDVNIQIVDKGLGPTTSRLQKSLLYNKYKNKDDRMDINAKM